ncbi:hypothetical protein LZG04_17160 [Saccharothrix sp. S26]|uniref:hypothetical protein n=1 Tax=Saccharothrix sp. S26 TaxID=2907215 RepID=UPI001F2A3227|nr:hypothetical protein [Saccharothrix sp. S26]MCE6996517.1 hypothetical protein [Saccharothrix sp. S26]
MILVAGQGQGLVGQRRLAALSVPPGTDPAVKRRPKSAPTTIDSSSADARVRDERGRRLQPVQQVALAWTRAESRAVLPLVGVSSVEQLTAAVDFRSGFPGGFIAECEPAPFVFGDTATRVEPR